MTNNTMMAYGSRGLTVGSEPTGSAVIETAGRRAGALGPTIYCPPTKVEQCVEADMRARRAE